MVNIQNPAPYIPPHAVAYANPDGSAALVAAATPLPVNLANTNPLNVSTILPLATPIIGTTSAVGTNNIGPFRPVVGRSVLMSLWGNWSGSVQVLRSTDNGVTLLPITIGGATWALYTTNCCEAVWDESEAAATLYLSVMLTSGTLSYRLAQ